MNDVPPCDDRERRMIEAVVSLAKTLREDRDRLARRLTQLEQEMDSLAVRLDAHQRALTGTVDPAEPGGDRTRDHVDGFRPRPAGSERVRNTPGIR